MESNEIKLDDLQRILLGEVPPSFYIEIVIRIFVIYFLLTLSMRVLGKRMAMQLTRNETAALVSLAAAVGVPILSPDRGLLPAFVIALVVVCISRAISVVSAKNDKLENITQGSLDILVKDAVINQEAMVRTRMTKERILSQLRSEQISQLGEVERLYIEANGNFTTIKNKIPKAGLSIIPDNDKDMLRELVFDSVLVCKVCGYQNFGGRKEMSCPNCKDHIWVPAALAKKKSV
jgi:uncharacterized membrane protein YcaP (DUF421 family)